MRTAASTSRRYIYLIGVSFQIRNGHSVALRNQNGVTWTSEPIASLDDARRAGIQFADHLASENPSWDRTDTMWRGTLAVLGVSLLRVEVEQRGRWVLADWQPWGPPNPT